MISINLPAFFLLGLGSFLLLRGSDGAGIMLLVVGILSVTTYNEERKSS